MAGGAQAYVAVATKLGIPFATAIAWSFSAALTVTGPVYLDDCSVGVLPSEVK
jgi:hypothetical protein